MGRDGVPSGAVAAWQLWGTRGTGAGAARPGRGAGGFPPPLALGPPQLGLVGCLEMPGQDGDGDRGGTRLQEGGTGPSSHGSPAPGQQGGWVPAAPGQCFGVTHSTMVCPPRCFALLGEERGWGTPPSPGEPGSLQHPWDEGGDDPRFSLPSARSLSPLGPLCHRGRGRCAPLQPQLLPGSCRGREPGLLLRLRSALPVPA